MALNVVLVICVCRYDEEDLIALSKHFINANNGCDDPETYMTDDFVFMGPLVGPFDRKRYVKAFTSFEIEKAIPDINGNIWGFHSDPLQPNRIWYFSKLAGTHSGYLAGSIKPTGKKIEEPPQALSLTFDMESGKVKKLTVGHVIDVSEGNTGGLGGVFGIFYRVGSPLPFREARPFKKSLFYRLFGILPQPLRILLFLSYPFFRPLGTQLLLWLQLGFFNQDASHSRSWVVYDRVLIAASQDARFLNDNVMQQLQRSAVAIHASLSAIPSTLARLDSLHHSQYTFLLRIYLENNQCGRA